MGNLVRDRIPEIIAAEGRKPRVRVLSDEEFEAALLDKLLEEVTELLEAEPENRLDEAADVYEVLLTLVAGQGFAADDLAVAADSKRHTRGGFAQRLRWDGP